MTTDPTLLALYAAALQGLCANPAHADSKADDLAADALAIAKAAHAELSKVAK
jgi:hypothetical protein